MTLLLSPPSHEGRPGGCAGRVDVVVGQPDCVGCKGVNVGGDKKGRGIGEAHICIALVICQTGGRGQKREESGLLT